MTMKSSTKSTAADLLRAVKMGRPAAYSRLALTLAEREEISRALAIGHSIRFIAARIGRAPSTVSREVKRNGGRVNSRVVR